MSFESTVLIVAVILVLFYAYNNKDKIRASLPAMVPGSTQKFTVSRSKAKSERDLFIAENDLGTEFFAQTCADPQLDAPSPCDCPVGSTYAFAKNAYGVEDGDFVTWAKNQAIDPTVAANHKEFISDRTGENKSVNVMGRTYTPADSHTSYTPDAAVWWGIRGRPSRVPVCNPDQLNDIDYAYYPDKVKLKWDSASTY